MTPPTIKAAVSTSNSRERALSARNTGGRRWRMQQPIRRRIDDAMQERHRIGQQQQRKNDSPRGHAVA